MSCFLIGSSGFVGSQIKSSLEADGFEVFALLRSPSENNLGSTVFSTAENGDFSMEELTRFMVSHGVSSVVHCGNVWDPSPSPIVAEKMLYANILVPAKVLRAAVEAKATTFVNLGSALQLDPEKALNAPDYASTKQAFRAFLSHQSSRLHTTSVFVNEIFGVGDTRRKLLNQAIDCAINNVHMTVQSAHRVLGFANVSRLASEIVSLLKNPASRPEEYVYQNYSNITLGEVLDTVGLLAGGLSWSESSQEEVPASVTSLESLGERAKKNFSIEIRDVLEFKKSHTV